MFKRDKITIIALAVIILAAGYLRLYQLGKPSFWVDELDFVNAAKSKAATGEPLLASGYPYPRAPLLTYAVMASHKLFGVSEWSSRLPAAIFGILSVPLVFLIGCRFWGERVGLMAALFLAFAPFAVGWSRALRMYSLFQFLFLFGFYFFYLGFEASRARVVDSVNAFSRLLGRWQLHVPWLVLAGGFLLLSYTAHQNAGLFGLSFLAYLLAGAMYSLSRHGAGLALRSKYVVLLGGILALGLAGYMLMPQAQAFVDYAIQYQPKWAEVTSAQNRWRIVEFFTSTDKMPFNLLFVLGVLLVLLRRDKAGVYSLLTFLVPVLMFSFVFQYRKNDYIFHVFPIFFLLAAVGLNAIIEWVAAKSESVAFLRTLPSNRRMWLTTAVLLIWFPLTPTFRFGQKIPRLSDGHFNGAIYHNEWKQAAGWLKSRLSLDDTLMSTLPQTVQHYLGRAEYNLNWSNSDLARQKQIVAADGRYVDFYSGTDVIENVSELENVLARHPRGWLLVDTYRFSNAVYVPEEVRDYILDVMDKAFETTRNTVAIYRWNLDKPILGTNHESKE